MGLKREIPNDVVYFDQESLDELRYVQNGQAYAEALQHAEPRLMIDMLGLDPVDARLWALEVNERYVRGRNVWQSDD